MLKPKDEKSKPAATSDNASVTTITEENSAQVSTAEKYLDKAEELVHDLVKWQQGGKVGNRWDMAIQRALEDTPEIATSLLRLLLTRYAPSGRDEEVGQRYHAHGATVHGRSAQLAAAKGTPGGGQADPQCPIGQHREHALTAGASGNRACLAL
jgi:hypothetical protein